MSLADANDRTKIFPKLELASSFLFGRHGRGHAPVHVLRGLLSDESTLDMFLPNSKGGRYHSSSPNPPCVGDGQHCAAIFIFYQFLMFFSYNQVIHSIFILPSSERLLRRILVMGGTRFIGCYLVAKLREMGHSVVPWLGEKKTWWYAD